MKSRLIVSTEETRARAIRILEALNIVERDWDVVISPHVSRRTHEQNARLWMLHARASEATGYQAEELHDLALKRYFGTREIQVGSVTLEVPLKRSSQRNIAEFTAFMEATEAFYISELGVFLDAEGD